MKGFSVVKTRTVSVLARPSEVWAFSSISEEKKTKLSLFLFGTVT